jgi:hypothetical protein
MSVTLCEGLWPLTPWQHATMTYGPSCSKQICSRWVQKRGVLTVHYPNNIRIVILLPKEVVLLNYLLIYLLTYLLTHSLTHSMVQDIILKADCYSACQKISRFLYETRRFITVFTKTRHWTLSRASWIQFAPSIPISLRSILMLSYHLRLGLPPVLQNTNSSPSYQHFLARYQDCPSRGWLRFHVLKTNQNETPLINFPALFILNLARPQKSRKCTLDRYWTL